MSLDTDYNLKRNNGPQRAAFTLSVSGCSARPTFLRDETMTSAERKSYDHARYIRNRAKILARAAERRKDPGHKLYMRLYYQSHKIERNGQ